MDYIFPPGDVPRWAQTINWIVFYKDEGAKAAIERLWSGAGRLLLAVVKELMTDAGSLRFSV